MRIGWICLAVVSLGILVFGLVEVLAPAGGDPLLYRADGWRRPGWACSVG